MADTITLSLTPEVMERLRRLADASGESVEAVAQGVLEETAAEFDDLMGDDAELARRLAEWREHRLGVPADEVHAWLNARRTDPNAPRPEARRLK